MQSFHVTPKRGEPFDVRAETISEAANAAAKRLVGKHAFAARVTGDPGLSGMFQAYVRTREPNQVTSRGDSFHVG